MLRKLELCYPTTNSNNILFSDTFSSSPTTSCDLPQSHEPSVFTGIARSPIFTNDDHNTDITVQAVWSQATPVGGSPSKGTQHVSSIKSLESVVLSLHNTAKSTATPSQQSSTGSPGSSTHNGSPGLSPNASMVNGKSQDSVSLELTSECRDANSTVCGYVDSDPVSLASTKVPAQISRFEDFSSRRFSSDEPYPVFLPSFPAPQSETECNESSPLEVAKKEVEVTFPSCCVSPLTQNNLELENAVGASPSTPDSRMPSSEGEATASSSAPCVTSLAASSRQSPSHEDLDSTTTNEQNGQVTDDSADEKQPVGTASSSGDSAFFEFLLTQGSDFNPAMKFQIVELIKGEFGKKMAGFNMEMFKMETEKRNLESEIQNSKLKLQQKEEERLRLFTEIEKLQKNIVEATEKHKSLSEKCMKLKEDSEVVKRKISSCEEVEKELFGTPNKMKKLVDR